MSGTGIWPVGFVASKAQALGEAPEQGPIGPCHEKHGRDAHATNPYAWPA